MHKKTNYALLFLLFTFNVFGRNTMDFNFDWKFHLGDDPLAKNTDYSDDQWRSVDLPHDWSIEQSYTTKNTAASTAFLPTGIGWYRKIFQVSEINKDTITRIEFDGIYHHSEVWINGHYLGKRPYGYSVFGYDLTNYLKEGNNMIAVKVDHSNNADSRWYTGSGIYRNVRLIQTSSVYIPQFGAWVETPKVDKFEANVSVKAQIKSANKKHRKLDVKLIVKDPNKQPIVKTSKALNCKENAEITFDISVYDPKRWSLENRHLYEAEIQIFEKGELKDSYTVDFGIRSIRFDPNEGFFLNEKNIKLKGVCLHHDAGAVGGVFISDVWKRRLQKLKDIGVNAIRSAHNPADPGFLKLCDEMGFLVINESFDEWRRNKDKWITARKNKDVFPEMKTGYGDIYEEWAERDVKDMVRYSRNHPSIMMWSIGNEIEWTYPYYWKMSKSTQGLANQVIIEETGSDRDELKETAIELSNWIKEVDQSRLVTNGCSLPKSGNYTGYLDVLDAAGYNYNAIRYDEDHEAYPNRIIYGSENWGTYQEWKDALERDFISGIFVWTGIAYMGEAGPFPWKGLEISFMDFCGFYTHRGHFFKTLWNDEPSTYLATKHSKLADWRLEDGKFVDDRIHNWLNKWLFSNVDAKWNYNDGEEIYVEVYSNSPEVELFINEKSYGIKKVEAFSDHIVKFFVPYKAGKIKAVGLRDGTPESEYSLHTARHISNLVLKADRTKMEANGYDVVHVEAYLQTKSGYLIPDNDVRIHFTIDGEGKNIGVDNGWDRNVQDHKSDQIVTHNGKAMLLVQSTRKEGEIKISARTGNMTSNTITVSTK